MAVLAVTAFSGAAFADGDAGEGEKVFKKCKACHMVGDDAKNRVGPHLNGIAGKAMGADADFKYSDAMMAKNAAGETWTDEALDAFLAKPKDFLPGTKMSFPGLKKEDDRENVIAYMKTFQ